MNRSVLHRDVQQRRSADRWRHPCWAGYRDLIERLDTAALPEAARLNALLPPGAVSGGGVGDIAKGIETLKAAMQQVNG
mgnify:CR=1 FL=1